MATTKQKADGDPIQGKKYKSRIGYYDKAKHHSDEIKNLGYDYRGNVLRNTTSPELWANPLQIPFYGWIESMIVYLIEEVKMIKKTFSIAHDKDSLNIT